MRREKGERKEEKGEGKEKEGEREMRRFLDAVGTEVIVNYGHNTQE